MRHKNTQSVLLCRVASLLCGIVALLTFGIFGWASIRSVSAVESAVDVVVQNPEVMDVSFDTGEAPYSFNLSLGTCEKITKHVNVTTNNPAGYVLYMRGGNNSSYGTNTLTNELYSTANANIFKSDMAGVSTCEQMVAGNKWGYAMAESSAASTFNTIPASDGQIASSASMTGRHAVTVAVAANNVVSGTYSGSLVFTATAPPNEMSTYFAIYYNGGTGATNVPAVSEITETAASHTFTISSLTPVRSGFIFRGWSSDSAATTVNYNPGATLTLFRDPMTGQYGPVLTLYAVWEATTPSNGGGDDSGSQAPMRSAPVSSDSNNSSSQDTEQSDSSNADSEHLSPKGVKEEVDTIENISGNGNLVPAIAALTVAAAATGGFIFFIVAKRDDDDDDEEEEGGAAE